MSRCRRLYRTGVCRDPSPTSSRFHRNTSGELLCSPVPALFAIAAVDRSEPCLRSRSGKASSSITRTGKPSVKVIFPVDRPTRTSCLLRLLDPVECFVRKPCGSALSPRAVAIELRRGHGSGILGWARPASRPLHVQGRFALAPSGTLAL